MDELRSIIQKMTRVEETLSEIKISLAKSNEADVYRKQNHENLVVKCNENRTKIVELEVQITAINTKLMIFGVVITVVIPLLTGFLMRLFFHTQ